VLAGVWTNSKAALRALQIVIGSIEAKQAVFNEQFQIYATNILNTIQYPMDWSWCLDYIFPLACMDRNTSPNHVQAFDNGCALLREYLAALQQKSEVASYKYSEMLQSQVLDKLLEVIPEINIYAQIAFETLLYILESLEINMEVLQRVSYTRAKLDQDHYNQKELIPFRCMRAEILRIIWLNCYINNRERALLDACSLEMKRSMTNEVSKEVSTRYKLILVDILNQNSGNVSSMKNLVDLATDRLKTIKRVKSQKL
jgi:hypothetical protein